MLQRSCFAFALSCLYFVGCAEQRGCVVLGNQGAVVVLLDYSKTFAPYDQIDRSAIDQIAELIGQSIRVGRVKQPTKVLWAAFGDDGLTPERPCGPAVVFAQKLTTARNSSPDLLVQSKMPDFDNWLRSCPAAVQALSNKASQFTDVSGALAFADDAVEDATQDRLVVIYSDMREDLPEGRKLSKFDLHNSRVAIVWRPGKDDREQPADVRSRIDDWSKTLRAHGASTVCNAQARSVTPNDLLSCLTRDSNE